MADHFYLVSEYSYIWPDVKRCGAPPPHTHTHTPGFAGTSIQDIDVIKVVSDGLVRRLCETVVFTGTSTR